MSHQIVCNNCGARYQLAETFSGARARCKHCGSTIEVSSQITGAETPAAARPARSDTGRAASHADTRHGGAHQSEPLYAVTKKSSLPLIIGGIGVLVFVVALVVLLGPSNRQPTKKDDAHAAARPAAPSSGPGSSPASSGVAAQPTGASSDHGHAAEDGPSMPAPAVDKPQGQQGQKPGEKHADKPAGSEARAKSLEDEREKLILQDLDGWKKLQVKSLDQVIDVKKTTQPLEYPPEVSADDQKKMAELLQKARSGGGGVRTGRALKELEKMGHPALFFLVNTLREIDYKSVDDSMFGFQLNVTLQNILGVNSGYVPVEIGEDMDPRKAQWNAMTVDQWIKGVKLQWPTRAKFDDYIAKRRARRDAELDAGK